MSTDTTTTKDAGERALDAIHSLPKRQQESAKNYLLGVLSVRNPELLERALAYANGERGAF